MAELPTKSRAAKERVARKLMDPSVSVTPGGGVTIDPAGSMKRAVAVLKKEEHAVKGQGVLVVAPKSGGGGRPQALQAWHAAEESKGMGNAARYEASIQDPFNAAADVRVPDLLNWPTCTTRFISRLRMSDYISGGALPTGRTAQFAFQPIFGVGAAPAGPISVRDDTTTLGTFGAWVASADPNGAFTSSFSVFRTVSYGIRIINLASAFSASGAVYLGRIWSPSQLATGAGSTSQFPSLPDVSLVSLAEPDLPRKTMTSWRASQYRTSLDFSLTTDTAVDGAIVLQLTGNGTQSQSDLIIEVVHNVEFIPGLANAPLFAPASAPGDASAVSAVVGAVKDHFGGRIADVSTGYGTEVADWIMKSAGASIASAGRALLDRYVGTGRGSVAGSVAGGWGPPQGYYTAAMLDRTHDKLRSLGVRVATAAESALHARLLATRTRGEEAVRHKAEFAREEHDFIRLAESDPEPLEAALFLLRAVEARALKLAGADDPPGPEDDPTFARLANDVMALAAKFVSLRSSDRPARPASPEASVRSFRWSGVARSG